MFRKVCFDSAMRCDFIAPSLCTVSLTFSVEFQSGINANWDWSLRQKFPRIYHHSYGTHNEKFVKSCLIYPKVNKQTRVPPQITSVIQDPSEMGYSTARSHCQLEKVSACVPSKVEWCHDENFSHPMASNRMKWRSLIGFVNNIPKSTRIHSCRHSCDMQCEWWKIFVKL